jgi:hypothetical protein
MKFARLAAIAIFFASLSSPSIAGPDTRVGLAGAMDGVLFPYGVRQGFKVLGDTKGQKCAFSYTVTLNGNVVVSPQSVSAPLPWNSPDLRLGASGGNNYTVSVTAVDSLTNACKGQVTLSYGVVSEIGKISELKTTVKVAAVNQTIGFTVSGTSFGYCKYRGAITRGGSVVANAVVTSLPYDYSAAFPDAGEYLATADEIDDSGAPEGCTGHLKTTFTVIPRPACPTATEYYQAADDSEFGCLVPGVYFNQGNYACPTGFVPFSQIGDSTQWGCRVPNKPLMSLSAVGALLGNAKLGGGGGPVLLAGSDPTQTDKPKILKVQAVAASGGAPRPNSNVFYAGELFQFDVSGNLPNSGGYNNPNLCGYTVEIKNSKGQITNQGGFTEFKIWDAGKIPAPGEYSIHAIPYTTPNGPPPACLGSAEIPKIHFYPKAAWVTGIKLVGFGYHFHMADGANMPEFCEACTSIFSPAHDRAFLQIIPTVEGATPGGTCTYNIQQTGGGNDAFNEVQYSNGDLSVPNNQKQFFSPDLVAPFWSMYGGASNTVTVTVLAGTNLGWPSCNIIGGKITKTITFFDDETKGQVVK